MKRIFLSFALTALTLYAFATKPHEDYIKVNTESSTVKWIGSKISESHQGTVDIKKGVLVVNHGTLVGGDFVLDMNTISTTDMSEKSNQKLDSHLKNEDFFNVELFPTAHLNIRRVMQIKGDRYNIMADLTIKGITHPVKFSATININGLNFSAQANIKIDRTKWDITYKSGNFFKDLGDKAILDEIEFDVFLISVK